MRLLLVITFFAAAGSIVAQSITGRWTTIDDNTGKPRSVVELNMQDGRMTGNIIDLYDKNQLDKRCDKCPDDRNNKPIVGLQIIRDMVHNGNDWHKGTILDPETGKIYDCKIWLEDGKLKVRGYVAFFYRTQTWVRHSSR